MMIIIRKSNKVDCTIVEHNLI